MTPNIEMAMESQYFEENYSTEPTFWVRCFEYLNNLRTYKRLRCFNMNSKRVLEVGVGSGSFLNFMKLKGYSVEGCDLAVSPNLLERNFSPDKANTVWKGDLTYVWTKEGWLFGAVIIDLWSRQVVGWSMDKRMTRELTLNALKRRHPKDGLIHHSDRGSQYVSANYQKSLKTHKMVCSMSRNGNCWNNAPVESFFSHT